MAKSKTKASCATAQLVSSQKKARQLITGFSSIPTRAQMEALKMANEATFSRAARRGMTAIEMVDALAPKLDKDVRNAFAKTLNEKYVQPLIEK